MTNEVSTKKKKRKKIMKVLAALMGVFLLIGCCSVGGLMFLGSSDVAVVTTTSTAPFPMVAIRHAIRATNEAAMTVPPLVVTTAANATNETAMTTTPTLAPTITPTPLPTDTPSPTSELGEVGEYKEELLPLLARYVEAFATWSDLAGNAVFNASGTDFSNTWKIELLPVLVEIQVVNENIRDLKPPACLEKSHDLLVEATVHSDIAVHLFSEGVGTFDVNLINQATEELTLVHQLVERATEAMNNNTCR